MDRYDTIGELYLGWNHQLTKAVRDHKRRTLFVCEFGIPLMRIEQHIADAPAHFTQHVYGDKVVLFSTETNPIESANSIDSYFRVRGIPCAIGGISYSGNSGIDVEAPCIVSLSVQRALDNLVESQKSKIPCVSELTDLLRR